MKPEEINGVVKALKLAHAIANGHGLRAYSHVHGFSLNDLLTASETYGGEIVVHENGKGGVFHTYNVGKVTLFCD